MTTLRKGFARDQIGMPWIIVERSGSLWALGFDQEMIPILRFIGSDDELETHLASDPVGYRKLRQVDEGAIYGCTAWKTAER